MSTNVAITRNYQASHLEGHVTDSELGVCGEPPGLTQVVLAFLKARFMCLGLVPDLLGKVDSSKSRWKPCSQSLHSQGASDLSHLRVHFLGSLSQPPD